jgi:N-acetylglucosamine kinase-like BadF-type ATPase
MPVAIASRKNFSSYDSLSEKSHPNALSLLPTNEIVQSGLRAKGSAMTESTSERLLLVIDGGGTKTRALIAPTSDVQAPPLMRLEAGPSNFGQVGREGLRAVVKELVGELPPSLRGISALVAGVAGVGRETERQMAHDTLRELFPGIPLLLRTDAELAYYGAFGFARGGILIIAGTGSIAWTRLPDGSFLRVGGWGPILGDEGSGAWIGREALRVCLREGETHELGPLSRAILNVLKLSEASDILTLVYQRGYDSRQWATLAPLVFEHAGTDAGADAIIIEAGAALARLAKRILAQIRPVAQPARISVVGGLTAHWSLLKRPFLRELMEGNAIECELVKPMGDALFGGRLIAQEAGIQ